MASTDLTPRKAPPRSPVVVFASALIAVLVLASCGRPDQAGQASPAGGGPSGRGATTSIVSSLADASTLSGQLTGRRFISTSVTGYDMVPNSTFSIEFGAKGAVTLFSECNLTSGTDPHLTGSHLSLTSLGWTEAMCYPAPAAANQQDWFGELMQAGVDLRLDGDMLTLTAAKVTVTMTNRRIVDPIESSRGSAEAPGPVAVVEEALKGLDSGIFIDVHLGSPPDGRDLPDSWFYATVKVPSMAQSATQLPRWEASLAEGVVAESLLTSAGVSDAIVGASLTGELPDGSTVDLGGAIGNIVAGQRFDNSSDDMVVDDIQAKLKVAGVAPKQIRVLHPLDNAVLIVATVPDIRSVPNGLTGIVNKVFRDINGTDAKYEGYYFELETPDGSPTAISTAASRISAGSTWVAPAYETSAGVVHG